MPAAGVPHNQYRPGSPFFARPAQCHDLLGTWSLGCRASLEPRLLRPSQGSQWGPCRVPRVWRVPVMGMDYGLYVREELKKPEQKHPTTSNNIQKTWNKDIFVKRCKATLPFRPLYGCHSLHLYLWKNETIYIAKQLWCTAENIWPKRVVLVKGGSSVSLCPASYIVISITGALHDIFLRLARFSVCFQNILRPSRSKSTGRHSSNLIIRDLRYSPSSVARWLTGRCRWDVPDPIHRHFGV